MAIINLALKDGGRLFHHHPHPFGQLSILADSFWRGGTTPSYGWHVPSKLPGKLRGNPACAILFSALSIELALFATNQPLPMQQHILGLVSNCYREVASQTQFVSPATQTCQQSVFAASAVISLERAWDCFSDFVARHIRLVEMREAERAKTQQQHEA